MQQNNKELMRETLTLSEVVKQWIDIQDKKSKFDDEALIRMILFL